MDCGYLFERSTASILKCNHNLCFEQKYDKHKKNSTEICHLYSHKNHCILHRRVILMRHTFLLYISKGKRKHMQSHEKLQHSAQ